MNRYIAALLLIFGLFLAHPAAAYENNYSFNESQVRVLDVPTESQVWINGSLVATGPALSMTVSEVLRQRELFEECYRSYIEDGVVTRFELGVVNLSNPFSQGKHFGAVLGTTPF